MKNLVDPMVGVEVGVLVVDIGGIVEGLKRITTKMAATRIVTCKA